MIRRRKGARPSRRGRGERLAASVLLATLCALLTVSCSAHPSDEESTVLVRDYGMFAENGVTEEKSHLAMSEVMAGPTFEEALASYDQMLEDMRVAVLGKIPGVAWEKMDDYPEEPCGGDYLTTDAVYTLEWWTVDGVALSQEQRDALTEILRPIAAAYGLTDYVNLDNRPQSFFTKFLGPQFAFAQIIANDEFWRFGFDTGCHLPQAVKDKVLAEGHYYWTPTPTDNPTGP